MLSSTLLLVCASVAQAASVQYTIEIRDWVVDYQRPTIEPRKAPFDVPDDAKMAAVLANNSFPGPSIEAYEGDVIEVTVVNEMLSQQVDIVWQGVEVKQSPPHLVGQQGGRFKYRMLASKAGTFFWRARLPLQAASGLKGALVVHSPKDPSAPMYQEERIMELSDAMQRPEVCLSPTGASDLGCPEIDKATLNGQWGDGSSDWPLPVIEVRKGRCYRLRWLGLMTQAGHFEVSIQDHSVRVLGKNATAAVPSFDVPTGAGVDTVLCADQDPILFKDYSVKMTYVGHSLTKSFSAVLRYSSAASSSKPDVHI